MVLDSCAIAFTLVPRSISYTYFLLFWLRFHVELIKNFGHFNYVSLGVSYLSIGLIILTLINCENRWWHVLKTSVHGWPLPSASVLTDGKAILISVNKQATIPVSHRATSVHVCHFRPIASEM